MVLRAGGQERKECREWLRGANKETERRASAATIATMKLTRQLSITVYISSQQGSISAAQSDSTT